VFKLNVDGFVLSSKLVIIYGMNYIGYRMPSYVVTSWARIFHLRVALIDWFLVFNATFSNYIMAISLSGGRGRSTRREPSTMSKQLVNFITCDCEANAPFCSLQSRARTHTTVLVIGLYEFLGNPTTWRIKPPFLGVDVENKMLHVCEMKTGRQ
jgi:hypothetical protein